MRFSAEEEFARQLDGEDSLSGFRDRFHIPVGSAGKSVIYFAGNSLGLMPRSVQAVVEQELHDWAELAVDAHLHGNTPWYTYHETLRGPVSRLVGASETEVVCMNSLTVNLHLMLATFYQPTRTRWKVLMEHPAFPSDTYAVKSQIMHHGLDQRDAFVLLQPRAGESTVTQEEIESSLEKYGEEIALVLIGAVNFFTGQLFDIAKITSAAHRHGIIVGVDLAHAIGNVPLALHDWNVDFAVWCSYKYLNGGPGAVGGAFIHERHATNTQLPRLAGWFGNDPETRFRLHLEPEFIPVGSADAWQVSNPPILSMAPLRASLQVFEDAGGIDPLRAKSIRLTEYLQFLLDSAGASNSNRFTVITPRQTSERGCQFSICVHEAPKELVRALEHAGVKCDFREPNVIRAAPTPLYNTFRDVWHFAEVLSRSH